MSYGGNRKNNIRPKAPSKPIKLAFGLIEKEPPPTQMPVQPELPQFVGRTEIIGTLDFKKTEYNKLDPLSADQQERIINNIKQMYEEGKFSPSKIFIDCKDRELLVSFPFEQSIVDRIKAFDKNERAWEPEKKHWRIFIGLFDDVFDILGKGIVLTDVACEELCKFVKTSYYAAYAKRKLGKLIVREHWFKELDLELDCPLVDVQYGSNAYLEGSKPEHNVAENYLEKLKKYIGEFPFKRKPYSHQISGVEYLLANNNSAILDEMGCGKSFQIASAIGIMFANKMIDKVLIVAPMSLLRTWQYELKLAIDSPYSVIYGNPAQRKRALESKEKIFLIHYEGLRLEYERISHWLKDGNSLLAFDESQRIKNLQSQTTRAAIKIRESAKRCIIATGTPIANRPLDLFSQYLVLDCGETFGKQFNLFKNSFCIMETKRFNVGRKTIQKEVFAGVKNGPEIRKRLLRTSLRRLKSDVLDLPPVIYKDYIVELSGEQKHLYEQMRDTLKIEITNMASEDVISEAKSLAIRLLRLAQITSNPYILDKGFEDKNAKFTELDMLLDDIFTDPTKKVILWSHFVDNVEWLLTHYQEKYKAVAHTGEMSPDKRFESVSAFQDDPECKLFIATPQSAKEGLTLLPKDGVSKADTMIYFDLNFDSASYIQSQARFHRIGQDAEKCLVIHMIAESTVDEYIRKSIIQKIQEAKKLLDNTVVEGLTAQTQSFSKQDLISLLS